MPPAVVSHWRRDLILGLHTGLDALTSLWWALFLADMSFARVLAVVTSVAFLSLALRLKKSALLTWTALIVSMYASLNCILEGLTGFAADLPEWPN